MDLNKTIELNPKSPPLIPFMSPSQHPTKQEYKEVQYHRFMQLQEQNLQIFWNQQLFHIQQISAVKSHQLPLARIRRIMKADGEVKMISADTPVLLAKACELLIMELTLRSWLQTHASNRRTLQRCDIGKAISLYPTLHFLRHAVPCHHHYMGEEIEKGDEETEGVSHVPSSLPMIDINKDFVLTNSKNSPQQFMVRPSSIPSNNKVN